MAILKKRSTAIAILVVVILAGTLFGAHRSLTGARNSVTKTFSNEDGSGYGIATNLSNRVKYARNLCKIAARYDVADATQAVQTACTNLEKAKTYGEKFETNTALSVAVNTLDQALQTCSLSDSDKNDVTDLRINIESYQNKIDKQATVFNNAVLEFNENTLGGFPASFLCKIAGVSQIEEYA